MFATWLPSTLYLHRSARSRWHRAVALLGMAHQPRRGLSRFSPSAEPFARDDNDDRAESLPVPHLRLDPDDVDYFFGLYRHGDPRQNIRDLCEGRRASKGGNGRDAAWKIQHRADNKNEDSTETEALSLWDTLGFIDEADSLLGSRHGGGAVNSWGWRRFVINQFLREMDGLEAGNAFVMAATNRPFDLDDAVLRRLPRKLLVDLPLEADSAAILRIHLAGEELDPAVSVDDIAKRTPLYSGSDLKNVCVAAAMACVYEGFGGEWGLAGQRRQVSSRGRQRVLSGAHFAVALSQISASVSVDMASLRAIKRFDDKYGDAGAKRQRRAGIGFGGNAEVTDADVPRVRT